MGQDAISNLKDSTHEIISDTCHIHSTECTGTSYSTHKHTYTHTHTHTHTQSEEAPPTWDSGHYTGDRIARWNVGVVPNAPTPLKKEGRKRGRIPSCFQDQTSGVEYECGMSTLRSCIAHTCYQVLIQHELKPYTGKEMVSCNFYI